MSFRRAVQAHFGGAQHQRDYLAATTAALYGAGFRPTNTLVAVSRCRDEITATLARQLEKVWGPTFELAGLSGMLSAGTTGIGAALAHVPRDAEGQSFLVLYALAHIGIEEDGTVGVLQRPGVDRPVPTCGSLAAAAATLATGEAPDAGFELFDLEQSRVVHRLASLIDRTAPAPDLAELTRLALQGIEDDIKQVFQPTSGHRPRPLGIDGALFTGVQIHGRDGRTLIWPSTSVIDLGGQLTTVTPGLDSNPGATGSDDDPTA